MANEAAPLVIGVIGAIGAIGAIRPPERIGFIGLGNMGAPMALRLAAAGYRLVIADAAPAAVERFRSQVQCEAPATLKELGATCRTIITMLPDGHVVRKVLMGEGGVVAGLTAPANPQAAPAIVIDMTSASPVGTRALSAELGKLGITLLDAPVSGGVSRAAEGKLSIMVGGDAGVVPRCRPILENLGQVFLTGASGSGHAMKALNNFLSAINLAAAGEAMLAGERFGLNPATMIEIFNASTGRNTGTDHKYPKFILPGTYNSGFALGLMAKDLRLALELARDSGIGADLLQTTVNLWSQAEGQLGGKADNTEVIKYLQSRSAPPGQSNGKSNG
jgi:3-hydroxyisobutyrate dehydrogenase